LDILISAKLAVSYVAGKNWLEFSEDYQLQDAVIRRLEIIGMRNIMIHQYNEVNMPKVWETVQNNLQPLIEALEKIVPPEKAE
jgi:uncharacterized protein with HEPN domain